jgi:hypothetical protein
MRARGNRERRQGWRNETIESERMQGKGTREGGRQVARARGNGGGRDESVERRNTEEEPDESDENERKRWKRTKKRETQAARARGNTEGG